MTSPEVPPPPPVKIADVAFPVPLHRTFHYLVPEGLGTLMPGARVLASFGPRKLTGTVLRVFHGQPERPLKELEGMVDPAPVLTAELLDAARWLARHYGSPVGECVRGVLPAAVKPVSPRARKPRPETERDLPPRQEVQLTPGQAAALAALSGQLREKRHAVSVLYGVPASGKTEVYLRLIREVEASGGQALFLLPEISLTGPFFREFKAALKGPVVQWHSRLGVASRREAWLGLRDGKVRVVVGARSAALLPFRDLRLVVLDEEHDESFKQDTPAPAYHARDVILHRAAACHALVVMGSATPSIESWQLCREGGARLISIPDRVFATEKPAVTIVPRPTGASCLSPELSEGLKARLARGEQCILLVNRRGFATLVMCGRCRWVDRCPACGVARVQHEAAGGFAMSCHHCGRKSVPAATCGSCGRPALRVAGTGTQRVVTEVRGAFPRARVLRFDRDSLGRGGQDLHILEAFQAREADVLVGTKLVAKSLHFPEVTLVGVVDADTMLNMPDFRAGERTLQLLAQVSGRSGRAHKPGEVIIQTAYPEHPALAAAAAGDYGGFAEGELVQRRELGYPPFTTLLKVILTGAKIENVQAGGESLAAALRARLPAGSHEVLGPAPALPPLERGRHRMQLLVKLRDPMRREEALRSLLGAPYSPGVRWRVDADPYD